MFLVNWDVEFYEAKMYIILKRMILLLSLILIIAPFFIINHIINLDNELERKNYHLREYDESLKGKIDKYISMNFSDSVKTKNHYIFQYKNLKNFFKNQYTITVIIQMRNVRNCNEKYILLENKILNIIKGYFLKRNDSKLKEIYFYGYLKDNKDAVKISKQYLLKDLNNSVELMERPSNER